MFFGSGTESLTINLELKRFFDPLADREVGNGRHRNIGGKDRREGGGPDLVRENYSYIQKEISQQETHVPSQNEVIWKFPLCSLLSLARTSSHDHAKPGKKQAKTCLLWRMNSGAFLWVGVRA